MANAFRQAFILAFCKCHTRKILGQEYTRKLDCAAAYAEAKVCFKKECEDNYVREKSNE